MRTGAIEAAKRGGVGALMNTMGNGAEQTTASGTSVDNKEAIIATSIGISVRGITTDSDRGYFKPTTCGDRTDKDR